MNNKNMDFLRAVRFGQKHPDFNYDDMLLIEKIQRLAKQDQRQCENACNGYGVVKGQMYYCGSIDDYAKAEYGYNVKSAYISEDVNIFDVESGKIREKISLMVLNNRKFRVEYQSDPRGNTVKLYYKDSYIEL